MKKLYKAKMVTMTDRRVVHFLELQILDKTDKYYILNLLKPNEKFKKVAIDAKCPFASDTKKKALEALINELEHTAAYARMYSGQTGMYLAILKDIRIAEETLKTLTN